MVNAVQLKYSFNELKYILIRGIALAALIELTLIMPIYQTFKYKIYNI